MKEIYSMKMATYLRKLGFKIESVEVNPYKPEFNMWLFKDTPELRVAMYNYKKWLIKYQNIKIKGEM